MTLATARAECLTVNCRLRKVDGEYIVKPIWDTNRDNATNCTYFTTDLQDAVRSARAMNTWYINSQSH